MLLIIKKECEHVSENTITKAGEMLTFWRASVESSLALLRAFEFSLVFECFIIYTSEINQTNLICFETVGWPKLKN